MLNLLNTIVFILTCQIGLLNASSTPFTKRKAEGWYWYEDRPKNEEVPTEEAPEPKAVAQKAKTPTDILNGFKKEAEKRLHAALVYPTLDNVRAYQEIQKFMFGRSELFAKRWLEVVFTNPHLDATIKHPVSQAARHVYLDEKRKHMEAKIKRLSQSHGLFFFFKSSCPYCHSFAPIVKGFADKYGWPVLAISMDGSTLPEFPNAAPDNGAAAHLNIQHLPTLMAIEPQSSKAIPLSYGMSSHDQIEDRIQILFEEGKL